MSLIASDPWSPAVIPQGTPAWTRERVGHLTASNMAKAVSFLKNGNESAERRKLKVQILAERMADAAVDHFVTDDMQWGLDCEQSAKEAYAKLTGRRLTDGGFVRHRSIEFFGASPDSFVEHDGLLETKCPRTETHVSYILAGVVPEDYKPQMLAQLACSGRRWCDFVSFDPRITDEKRRVFLRRFEPTPEEIAAIEDAARRFLAEVDDMWEQLISVVQE